MEPYDIGVSVKLTRSLNPDIPHAGCESNWLETNITTDWLFHPWRQAKNIVGQQEIKEIRAAANILRKQARKLEPYRIPLTAHVLFHSDLAAEAISEAPWTLRDLADHLDLACDKSAGTYTTAFVATRHLPWVISEVKRLTGRPHFEELATLYEASYKRNITSEKLRMLEFHEKQRLRKQNHNGSTSKRG